MEFVWNWSLYAKFLFVKSGIYMELQFICEIFVCVESMRNGIVLVVVVNMEWKC